METWPERLGKLTRCWHAGARRGTIFARMYARAVAGWADYSCAAVARDQLYTGSHLVLDYVRDFRSSRVYPFVGLYKEIYIGDKFWD